MAKKAFIVDNGLQPGHTTNDLGHTANKFRDIHLHNNAHMDGTIYAGAIAVAAGGFITIDGVNVGTGGGSGGGASVSTGSTVPSSPNNGDLWYNKEDGSLYIYFFDGTSSQWVQVVNPFGTPSVFELDGITDGSDGHVLTTDGNGTATFSALPFIPLNLVQLNDFPSTESQNQVLTTDGSNNYAFEYVASENLTWSYYNDVADLPSASTKHGMFAHVHNTGKAYYAHAGNWVELANIGDLFSESYNDLTDLPSIPQVLTDLQITDGTAEQVLTANGDGTYTFADRIGARMQVSATAPTGQLNLQGDLWYNTEDGSMYVYYVDADSGQWVQVVNPFGVPGLDELDDVIISNVQPNQFLQYNDSLNQWVNTYPSIQHLSDVDDSSAPVNGQILKYNDSASEFKLGLYDYHDLTSLPSLQDLTDVTALSNPAHQNFLRWDSSTSSWGYDVVEYEDLATKPSLQDLTDVDSDATLANDQIMYYNSIAGEWQFKQFNLQQMGDVSYTTVNNGQVLTWDSAGGNWQAQDRVGASVTISATAPPVADAIAGDIWYSSDDGSFYIYYQDLSSSQWVQVLNPLPENFPKHNWQETSLSSYNPDVNESVFVDCSAGAVVINLPSSPTQGDEVRIVDATGNASTNNITINRNGNPIEGSNTNLVINTDRRALGLVFYNATQGWLFTEK